MVTAPSAPGTFRSGQVAGSDQRAGLAAVDFPSWAWRTANTLTTRNAGRSEARRNERCRLLTESTSALEDDQEPQRHSIARESGTAKITQTCDARLSKGGCIRLPCLIVSPRRSRRPTSGAGSRCTRNDVTHRRVSAERPVSASPPRTGMHEHRERIAEGAPAPIGTAARSKERFEDGPLLGRSGPCRRVRQRS